MGISREDKALLNAYDEASTKNALGKLVNKMCECNNVGAAWLNSVNSRFVFDQFHREVNKLAERYGTIYLKRIIPVCGDSYISTVGVGRKMDFCINKNHCLARFHKNIKGVAGDTISWKIDTPGFYINKQEDEKFMRRLLIAFEDCNRVVQSNESPSFIYPPTDLLRQFLEDCFPGSFVSYNRQDSSVCMYWKDVHAHVVGYSNTGAFDLYLIEANKLIHIDNESWYDRMHLLHDILMEELNKIGYTNYILKEIATLYNLGYHDRYVGDGLTESYVGSILKVTHDKNFIREVAVIDETSHKGITRDVKPEDDQWFCYLVDIVCNYLHFSVPVEPVKVTEKHQLPTIRPIFVNPMKKQGDHILFTVDGVEYDFTGNGVNLNIPQSDGWDDDCVLPSTPAFEFEGLDSNKFGEYQKTILEDDKDFRKSNITSLFPNSSEAEEEEEEFVDTDGLVKCSIRGVNQDLTGVVVEKVLALKSNDALYAYRIVTNKGSYDILVSVARRLGIRKCNVTKSLKLHNYEGSLVTKSEIRDNLAHPDISNDEEFCIRLIELAISQGK